MKCISQFIKIVIEHDMRNETIKKFYKYIIYVPCKNDYEIRYFTQEGLDAIKKTDVVLVKEIGFEQHKIEHTKPESWDNK